MKQAPQDNLAYFNAAESELEPVDSPMFAHVFVGYLSGSVDVATWQHAVDACKAMTQRAAANNAARKAAL